MCYCAPFFNHVEKKLDANKKELLNHIDSCNEDLKLKMSHLEKRTHDQLFTLNQKMKETLAIERGECAERIDRRLFRERRELEQQQDKCVKALESEMKSLLNGQVPNGHFKNYSHAGGQPLTRSKSEDLLSETNSNHNSVSLLSSTVTGVSRFTNNSLYNRTYLNPVQCGTKPKVNVANVPNISRLRMRCMGYPELKRESRSEGDLTSCHTDTTEYNAQGMQQPRISNVNIDSNVNTTRTDYQPQLSSYRYYRKAEDTLWKNVAPNQHAGFQSDASKSQNTFTTARSPFCTKYTHDQNRQSNGFSIVQGNTGNGLPPHMENDGSSFV